MGDTMGNITIIQAVLCGMIYWLAIGNLPFVGLWTLQKPFVCGTLTGLLLGHPVQGAVIGASINLIYLGFISAGGSMPADISLAGILGTVFAITNHLDTKVALALAVPIGLLGTLVWTGRMTFDSVFVHMADRYIEKEEYHKIWRANVLYPQIMCFFMTVIPCAVAIYFGVDFVDRFLEFFEGNVLTVLQIIGGLMPALGIAITLQNIYEGESRVFLFVGFMLAVYTDLPLLTLGIIALLTAIIYVQVTESNGFIGRKQTNQEEDEEDGDDDLEELAFDSSHHLIPQRALFKAWLIWETFPQTCYNYERMMGQHMAHVFTKVISYLHEDHSEKRKEIMKREMDFFNVHVEFGACIPGMAIALEEMKAMGKPIPGDLIKNLKTSFMGPLAGLGDTIWQGVFVPVLLVICIDISNTDGGNVYGVILYTVIITLVACALSYRNFMFGYKAGYNAMVEYLEKGILQRLTKGASIMGCMVMGSLIINYVTCTCGIVINTSVDSYNIQEQLLDHICPGILPFIMTMLIYFLMKKKRWPVTRVIFMIFVLGVLGDLTGILTT